MIVPGLEIGASLLREGRLLGFLTLDELTLDCEMLGVNIRELRVLGLVRFCGSILLELLLVPRELLLDRDDIEGRDD